MLTPQQQQQLMLQAQQNLSSPTSSDVDNRRLRMMLNSRNAVLGRDGQTNSGTDIIPNIASPSQSGGDIDILIKVYLLTSALWLFISPTTSETFIQSYMTTVLVANTCHVFLASYIHTLVQTEIFRKILWILLSFLWLDVTFSQYD